jgi:hypothetical protein
VRFDFENAVTLCSKCHMRYTHNPLAWEAWVEERFPGKLGMLKARALSDPVKLDYDALCEALKLAIGVRRDK